MNWCLEYLALAENIDFLLLSDERSGESRTPPPLIVFPI